MTAVTATSIDARRLARAVWLEAEKLGPGRYRVSGGSEPHDVNLGTQEGQQCNCPDYLWRGNLCKHVLLVKLLEGDADVVRALRKAVAL